MARAATAIKTKSKSGEDIYVRIHRHKKPNYPHIKNFMIYNLRFTEDGGWYKLKSTIKFAGEIIDLRGHLEGLNHDNEDPESPPLFDVVTLAEAQRIEKREAEIEKRQKRGRQVSDSIDLTGGRRRRDDSERGDLTDEDVRPSVAPARERSVRAARPEEVREETGRRRR